MQLFEFAAIGPNGKRIKGREFARDELHLDECLETRGLVMTSSSEIDQNAVTRSGSLKGDDLVTFTTQLATVSGAGVPIIEGLEGIAERMPRPQSRALVEQMVEGLRAGNALSAVMQPYKGTFTPTYLASVRAGEESGSLDKVLDRLARYMEWSRTMRATTIQALIYPGMLMLAILGLILILLFHVLPSLMKLFPANESLPWQTELVLGISNGLQEHWIILGIGILALVGALLFVRQDPKLRVVCSTFFLRIPKLGSVLTKLAMSRFASTAATLHAAGCDVFTVLNVSSEACGSAGFSAAFERSIERVRQGSSISDGLAQEPIMDPLLIQMVSVGERTGALDHTLGKLCSYYDDDVPRTVKRFLSVLEPLLLVGSGVLVAFILMAAVLPLFQLYETVG